MRSPVLPPSKVKNAVVLPLLMAVVSCSTVKNTPATGPENQVPLYAINAGGGDYLAKDGIQYAADHFVKGGSFGSSGDPITGTADQALFQKERWGRFIYEFPVKDGEYDVEVHFAETWFGPKQQGNRAFDVQVEGDKLLASFDPQAQAGHDGAYTATFKDIAVTDGKLTLDFLPVKDSASVRGIVVMGQAGNTLSQEQQEEKTLAKQPSAFIADDCPSGDAVSATDFILFDGGKGQQAVVANTLELNDSWFLDETWATSSGALVAVQEVGDGSAIVYHNAKGFSGFKLTPPAAHGERQTFKVAGMDIYADSRRSGPEFGVRVIKPGEPENNGHAPTATWLESTENGAELVLSEGCTLYSLSTPHSWAIDSEQANRFILEVREGWGKEDVLSIRRIVLRGYSDPSE